MGAAVDLSTKTLEISIDELDGTDIATIIDANITVSGAGNNQITFAIPAAASASAMRAKWSLRDTADGNRTIA